MLAPDRVELRGLAGLNCDQLVRQSTGCGRSRRVGQRRHREGVECRRRGLHLGRVAEGEPEVATGARRQVVDELDGPRKRPAAGRRGHAAGREAVVQVRRSELLDAEGRHVNFPVGTEVVQGVKGVRVVEDDPDVLRAVARVLVCGRDGLRRPRQEPVENQVAVGAGDLDGTDGARQGAVDGVAQVRTSGASANRGEAEGKCASADDGNETRPKTPVVSHGCDSIL